MCRFAVYHGHPIMLEDLLYKPKHSLVEQSMHAEQMSQAYNADGFGLGFYTPGFDEPCVLKSTTPAWSNLGLKALSQRLQSSNIFAHVRAASPGLAVQDTNCHPFSSEFFQFMHNGAIENFVNYKRAIQDRLTDHAWSIIHGTTDTEHAFAMFIDNIFGIHFGTKFTADQIRQALVNTLFQLADISKYTAITGNFAVTDGHSTVVSRFAHNVDKSPSLYYCVGQSYTERPDGDCDMFPSDPRGRDSAIIIASEPITRRHDEWKEVPQDHTIVVSNSDNGLQVEIQPI